MKDVAVPQTSAATTLCGSVRSWLISTHTEAGEALKLNFDAFRGFPRPSRGRPREQEQHATDADRGSAGPESI